MSWNFSIEKLSLVDWGAMNFWWGVVYCGDFYGQEGWLIFGQCVRDSLHPPSSGNPVVHPKSVENFKSPIWLSPPRERWKFKIPQDLIKLSSHLPGGGSKIPCIRFIRQTSDINRESICLLVLILYKGKIMFLPQDNRCLQFFNCKIIGICAC